MKFHNPHNLISCFASDYVSNIMNCHKMNFNKFCAFINSLNTNLAKLKRNLTNKFSYQFFSINSDFQKSYNEKKKTRRSQWIIKVIISFIRKFT